MQSFPSWYLNVGIPQGGCGALVSPYLAYTLPSHTDTPLVTSVTRNLVCFQPGLLQISGLDSDVSAWPPHILSQGSSGICPPSSHLCKAELQRSSRILSPFTATTIHDQGLLALPLNRYQTCPLIHSQQAVPWFRHHHLSRGQLHGFLTHALVLLLSTLTLPQGDFLGHRLVFATFRVLKTSPRLDVFIRIMGLVMFTWKDCKGNKMKRWM